jgi:tripartite-type tricarboxylate transporter receptor subunit TctC
MNHTRRKLLLGASALLAGAPLATRAQGLSSRPVHFLLAQSASTTPDVIARLLAPRFSARWNQPFVVENRVGAAGAIGMDALAKSAPDGHTMQVMPSSIVTLPLFFPNVTFDMQKSFQCVSLIGSNNFALVAHSSLGVKTVPEFIRYVKSHPGVNYASPGNGTSHHLFMEQLKLLAGLDMTHVPYKGSAGAFNDLLGGHIKVMFMPIHVAVAMAKDDRVNILGGSMKERSPLFPDLPSIQEQGVKDYDGDAWFGFWGPAGLSPELVGRYGAELRAILAEPEIHDGLAKQGVSAKPSKPEEMAAAVRSQFEIFSNLVRVAHLKPG